MTKESRFQKEVIKTVREIFPDCIILKNDPSYLQGVPDLLVLWEDRWAALECKASITAAHQVNQAFYVKKMNEMSFAAFVFPSNMEYVLNALQFAFESPRSARVPRS